MEYSELYASVKLSNSQGKPSGSHTYSLNSLTSPIGLSSQRSPSPPVKDPTTTTDKHLVGTLVSPQNSNYTLVQCMKMALSKSIQSISMPEKARPLDPKKDFTIKTKVQFSGSDAGSGCCGSTPIRGEADSLPSFVFTDYSPMCYCHMRAFLKVEWKELHEELCEGDWNILPTPGKSSALLFFCGSKGHQAWVVKTMTSGESKFLRHILHRYYYHVKTTHTRYYPTL